MPVSDPPNTLLDLLTSRGQSQPSQRGYTFLIDGESETAHLTYGELHWHARATAALLQRKIAPGDRVLLLYPPGLEYIKAFFGCLYSGGIPVPAYPPRMNKPDLRLQAIVADARPAAVLTTTEILATAERRLMHLPEFASLQWMTMEGLDEEGAAKWQPPSVDPGSVAFLQYTSGSTAAPKGVMVTHANLLHNLFWISERFGHTRESRGVIWLPPFHDMGLIGGILQPLYVGFPVVLMAPLAFLSNPVRWLRAISQYRGTVSGGPNFAYDLCVRKLTPAQRAGLDLSSWEVAFNGAERIRHETLQQFAETFAENGFRRQAFVSCYGLAEASLMVSCSAQAEGPRTLPIHLAALEKGAVAKVEGENVGSKALVSCGRVLTDQKAIIVDPESCTALPPNRLGEIWIQGPSVAEGYWNKPEETARTFRAKRSDTGEGPFLRTGDVGFLQGGELFVAGRLKDLIIIRGHNHYADDIEITVERAHPSLRPGSGAAFSVEINDSEQLVVVQEVEPHSVRNLELDPIATAIRAAVAAEHGVQVHGVVLLKPQSIPKTSSGKVQRHLCRKGFLDHSLVSLGSSLLETAPAEANVSDPADSFVLRALRSVDTDDERNALLRLYLREQVAQLVRVAPLDLDPEQPLNRLGVEDSQALKLKGDLEAALSILLPAADSLQSSSLDGLAAVIQPQLQAHP